MSVLLKIWIFPIVFLFCAFIFAWIGIIAYINDADNTCDMFLKGSLYSAVLGIISCGIIFIYSLPFVIING